MIGFFNDKTSATNGTVGAMKTINERIAGLDLDWREAEALKKEMDAMRKEHSELLDKQSAAFGCLWRAIDMACQRSVMYKRRIEPDLQSREEMLRNL
jgi:hypothetical protein